MSDAPDTLAELKARALRYLARREHSRAELARKLSRYAESVEILEGVLCELERKKQLSNERFAETRAHWMARKYGVARIRQDLQSKGISEEISNRVTPEAADAERASAILRRKYRYPATTREECARRARFLQSRGFSYDVIRVVLGAADGA